MSKIEKLMARLLTKPTDFSWAELKGLLCALGYIEVNMGKSSGSRVRFVHSDYVPIILHKPHPKKI